ncbi:hypothetical protein LTR94_027292 [Friedmanniomyces endolithicus]|nr:hypothetical protein LTR94_027292 [Friedmanniomyces endolithicus]
MQTSNGSDEKPGRVAYQGAPGAFSHEACTALRPWDEAVPFETFKEAIDALRSGDCDSALIPVENSSIGVVEPAASLVAASGLDVIAEAWRPIRHALMGLDGARISDLKKVLSHPIALAQCEQTLKGMKLNVVEHFDTAGAARDVAEAGDLAQGAIAPRNAAEVYGLVILRNDLQDSSDNRTRFVLLSAPKG